MGVPPCYLQRVSNPKNIQPKAIIVFLNLKQVCLEVHGVWGGGVRHISISLTSGLQVPQGSRKLGPGMAHTLYLHRMPMEVPRLPPGKSIMPGKGVALLARLWAANTQRKIFCRDIIFPTLSQNKSNKQMKAKIPLHSLSLHSGCWTKAKSSKNKFPFFLHLYWKIEQMAHISYHLL